MRPLTTDKLDAELDAAVRAFPAMRSLLQQDMRERATLVESIARMRAVVGDG